MKGQENQIQSHQSFQVSMTEINRWVRPGVGDKFLLGVQHLHVLSSVCRMNDHLPYRLGTFWEYGRATAALARKVEVPGGERWR